MRKRFSKPLLKGLSGLNIGVIFLCMWMSPMLVWAQEEGQKPIVEKVDVVNIEVPVRVLYKGQPVTDLKVEDFTLYENNKKVNINGFFLKRKTFNLTTTPAVASEPTAPAPTQRTFVLVFNISHYNSTFEQAVDHLFEKILKAGDRVLVLANDTSREYLALQDLPKVKSEIIKDLQMEGSRARVRLLEYIQRIETYMNVNDFRMSLGRRDSNQAFRVVDFFKKFLMTWKDYQKQYLLPKVDKFYYFARYLEKIRGPKWVISFYQFEFFPRIRPGSQTMDAVRDLTTEMLNNGNATMMAQARLIDNMMNQLNSDLVVSKGFPNEEISKLFYKVDATFHSIFIKSTNTAFLQDMEYNSVSSDLEKVLKNITDITGGQNITSLDMVSAIDTISTLEDSYYILTYVPENPKKAGTLKIKVNERKYKVLYDDNFREDYIERYFKGLDQEKALPTIKIMDFSFTNKVLNFIIKQYSMDLIDGVKSGRFQVRIRLVDNDSKQIFDSSKVLTTQKEEQKISIPAFKSLAKGQYNFLIDVLDVISNKQDNFVEAVEVK